MPKKPTKWIICFTKTKNTAFYRFWTWTRKEFSHVFAVRYYPEYNQWFVMDFNDQGFRYKIYKDDSATHLIAFLIKRCICVDYTPKSSKSYTPLWLYCTTFIKHLVNIRKFWIVTPYQLYCELLKQGGKVIFTEDEKKVKK